MENKMKKLLSVILALVMLAALCVPAYAAPTIKPAVTPKPASAVDNQLSLLFANLEQLKQDTEKEVWKYTITDLDHNGSLELVGAMEKGEEYYTFAKIWEVGSTLDTFIECDMGVKEGEPFVDIICDSADTYYDKQSDTWYYMFSEDYLKNEGNFYAVKCSVSLKEGCVSPVAYAYEHTEVINGIRAVEYNDLDGNILTPEEYNAVGTKQFSEMEKSCTNFGWFTMKDVKSIATLAESYGIFSGEIEPPENNKQGIIIVPSPEPTQSPSGFLRITKNPTNEYTQEGDTAWFVAHADNAVSRKWTFISPNGFEVSARDFELQFIQCKVSGENSDNLRIDNVCEAMSGWGAMCTFSGNKQVAYTSTATLYVSSKPTPTPVPTFGPLPTGSMSGSVCDFLMSSVTIYLGNGTTVQVLKDICSVSGSLFVGAPCTVHYYGDTPNSNCIFSVVIQGREDEPEIDPVLPPYEEDLPEDAFILGEGDPEYVS